MELFITTGNSIVDAVGQLNLSGNIIPESWYKTIVNAKGTVNFIAINILAEIVYWYRPTEIRDEFTNKVTYKKKFAADDFVQKSYKQLCSKFNISEKQAREAIKLLESLGVIKRHLRTIQTNNGCCSNVMFLELFPDVLKQLTFPSGTTGHRGISLQGNSYCPTGKHLLPSSETTLSPKVNTYTKSTTEISSKIITSSDAAAHNLLSPLGIDDSEINKIINTANGDIDKVSQAVDSLKASHSKIDNIVGFLISAIRNNYHPIPFAPKHKSANDGIIKHNYNFAEIEAMILK